MSSKMCLLGSLWIAAAAVGQQSSRTTPNHNASNSPLVALEAREHGVELAIDADRVDALRTGDSFRLRGVPVDAGVSVDLDMTRFEVFTPDAEISVWDGDQKRTIDRPDVLLLRGAVAGDDGSTAFLAISDTVVNGFIDTGDNTYIISNGLFGADDAIVAYNMTTLPEGAMTIDEFICRVGPEHGNTAKPNLSGGQTGTRDECGFIELAIDTDYEFTNILFGNSESAAVTYIQTLVGATSTIYLRDVGIAFSISHIRLWDTNSDPYSGNVDDYLNELQFQWSTDPELTDIPRDLAHVLTPTSNTGGVAYRDFICDPLWGYGASSGIEGYFPQPLGPSSQNWDLVVFAHELGHNCGAQHTHELSPPVDNCGNGNCAGASNGTIMSYCHLCFPGVANINLEFHPRLQADMQASIAAASCVDLASTPVFTEQPISQEVCFGEPATLMVDVDSVITPTYQWYRNSLPIPGATSSAYIIASYDSSYTGVYYVQATTPCGTVTSSIATLEECPVEGPCSPADLTTQNANEGDPDYGVPDHFVTGSDILYYVNAWLGNDLDIADLTTTGVPEGGPGYGQPDGSITGIDLQFYVNIWFEGCLEP